MALHKIRSSHRPEKELKVDDAELLDIERYGMRVNTTATTDEGARKAAEAQAGKPPAKKAAPRRAAAKKAAKPAGQTPETGEPQTGDSSSTTEQKEG
jgi:hypothetical protein